VKYVLGTSHTTQIDPTSSQKLFRPVKCGQTESSPTPPMSSASAFQPRFIHSRQDGFRLGAFRIPLQAKHWRVCANGAKPQFGLQFATQSSNRRRSVMFNPLKLPRAFPQLAVTETNDQLPANLSAFQVGFHSRSGTGSRPCLFTDLPCSGCTNGSKTRFEHLVTSQMTHTKPDAFCLVAVAAWMESNDSVIVRIGKTKMIKQRSC